MVDSEHCAPIQAVLSCEESQALSLLVSYSASRYSYRSPHRGCLQYPWTLFCSLRIAGSGVGGSPAAAVSGRWAAQLKAAVCLVGVPESYRKELSVRAHQMYPEMTLAIYQCFLFGEQKATNLHCNKRHN